MCFFLELKLELELELVAHDTAKLQRLEKAKPANSQTWIDVSEAVPLASAVCPEASAPPQLLSRSSN